MSYTCSVQCTHWDAMRPCCALISVTISLQMQSVHNYIHYPQDSTQKTLPSPPEATMKEGAKNAIPTVDLSPFSTGDEQGQAPATATISEACQTYGFFRIIHHGVPTELLCRALNMSKQFFALPDAEKHRVKPVEGSESPLPTGYSRQPEHAVDKNEYFIMFPPEIGFNLYPDQPPEFKPVVDECFQVLTQVASLIQQIVNDCMALPPNFLKEYNSSRSSDFMIALRYFPATEMENTGLSEHQDSNIISLLFQDEVGGLQVLKDGNWIEIEPSEGDIIVNLGDTIQVLSNNKFKSATHRVVRKGAHRHSIAFFYNVDGDKWVEPLPQFTTDIGQSPQYRGFRYNEYQQLRLRNKTHPPSRPEDAIGITHYSI